MPYDPRQEYAKVPPEKKASYRGLVIYYTHPTRDVRELSHWFYQLLPENDSEREPEAFCFDIRDLENPQRLPLVRAETHAYLLKDAIDTKALPPKEWCEKTGWRFKLKEKK